MHSGMTEPNHRPGTGLPRDVDVISIIHSKMTGFDDGDGPLGIRALLLPSREKKGRATRTERRAVQKGFARSPTGSHI